MNHYQNNAPDEEQKTSKINAAGLINITLEKIWNESYEAMAKNNYDLWNKKLDAIWLILGADTKPNDDTEKEYNRIEILLHDLGTLAVKTVGFEKVGESGSNKTMQYLRLKQKALFLRRLQNSQGKGTAYKSNDDFDFE